MQQKQPTLEFANKCLSKKIKLPFYDSKFVFEKKLYVKRERASLLCGNEISTKYFPYK